MSHAPLPVRPAAPAPASEEEVVALVRDAAAARTPLHIWGAGTKRHYGPAGSADAQPLSLRALSRVTSYEPGDMVVGVQAGVKLAELQRTLATRGQWLPVDPPHLDATVGGVLATAGAGPRRLGYGGVKDHLLGMRVVGASGVVTKSGGRVVKNVTGYDLHKLHVGAYGSLGVILEAHFKVQPRPELSGAAVFGCPDLESAHRLLLDIWATPLRPVALEAMSAGALATFGALAAGIPVARAVAVAVVGIEGSRLVFERHLKDLEAFRTRAASMTVLRGPAAQNLWSGFRDAPDRRRDEITVRIGARPHDLPTLLREVAASGAGLTVQAASGVARALIRRAPVADLAPLVHAWHAAASACGGYAVVESAPLDLEGREELPFSAQTSMTARRPAAALGRALKQQWDPDGILNPGRMALPQ
jgi:glycolate oxidase FAD binding subunit